MDQLVEVVLVELGRGSASAATTELLVELLSKLLPELAAELLVELLSEGAERTSSSLILAAVIACRLLLDPIKHLGSSH